MNANMLFKSLFGRGTKRLNIGCSLCEEKDTSTLELSNEILQEVSENSSDAKLFLSSIPIPKVRGNS